MHKNFKYYALIWAILLALFHVIAFVSPAEAAGMTKFGGAFWSGYVFITLAFVGQLLCAFRAFKAESSAKLFYSIPVLTISWTGLVLTMIFGGLCMMIPDLPNWVGIILCLAVLAFTAVAVIKAALAADIVAERDTEIKAQAFFVRSLTADAEGLVARAKSETIKAECKKVYEAVRYSDPMSSDALAAVESEIRIRFSNFSRAVSADDAAAAAELANEVVILMNDRNNKCKLLK